MKRALFQFVVLVIGAYLIGDYFKSAQLGWAVGILVWTCNPYIKEQ